MGNIETMKKLDDILKILYNSPSPPKNKNQLIPPNALNICSPIKTGEVPQYNISFDSVNPLLQIPNEELSSSLSSCSNLQNSQITLSFSLDFFFNQNWLLKNIAISDIASTITLAPSEKLTLEFQNTQRKLLEQSILDSTEDLQSNESTSMDKDLVNVIRDSSKTKNWTVNAKADVTIPLGIFSFSLGGGGGVNEELTEKNKTASQSIRESTIKSSQNLKSLHKIEVKGTSEYIVSNKMTRVIENPFNDRALNVNVFQLVKNFVTELSLKNIKPSLVLDITNFKFDEEFIQSNAHFLKDNLLDLNLADNLDTILESIDNFNVPEIAKENAFLALDYLFNKLNIFNAKFIPTGDADSYVENDPPPPDVNEFNNVKNSFDASKYIKIHHTENYDDTDRIELKNISALNKLTKLENSSPDLDVRDPYLLQIFLIFSFFYDIYKLKKDTNSLTLEIAYSLVNVLASKEIQSLWQAPHTKHALSDSMNQFAITEILRRIPGFFTMVNHMVKPFIPKLEQESFIKSSFVAPESSTTESTETPTPFDPYLLDYYKSVQQKNISSTASLNNLIEHLNLNKDYYIQSYLKYISSNSKNQSISDFVINTISQIVESTDVNKSIKSLIPLVFNVDDSFVNNQQIIIPGYKTLSDSTITDILKIIDSNSTNFSLKEFIPLLDELQIPTDGIHLEVCESNCILKDLNIPNNCK